MTEDFLCPLPKLAAKPGGILDEEVKTEWKVTVDAALNLMGRDEV